MGKFYIKITTCYYSYVNCNGNDTTNSFSWLSQSEIVLQNLLCSKQTHTKVKILRHALFSPDHALLINKQCQVNRRWRQQFFPPLPSFKASQSKKRISIM
jgi:hypothetical protein